MTVIDDVINHFEDNWNITLKPDFFNGHKEVVEGQRNYIYIFNYNVEYTDAESSGNYRDEHYRLLLRLGCTVTQEDRDDMLAEMERLCAEDITGYKYNLIIRKMYNDSTKEWKADVIFELIKFMVEK